MLGEPSSVALEPIDREILYRRGSLRNLPLCLVLAEFSDEDLDTTVGNLVFAVFEAWTNCNSQEFAVLTEGHSRDTGSVLWVDSDSTLSNGVPDRDNAVTATGYEGAVNRMESECVDRVYDVDTVNGLAMAFECIFSSL